MQLALLMTRLGMEGLVWPLKTPHLMKTPPPTKQYMIIYTLHSKREKVRNSDPLKVSQYSYTLHLLLTNQCSCLLDSLQANQPPHPQDLLQINQCLILSKNPLNLSKCM